MGMLMYRHKKYRERHKAKAEPAKAEPAHPEAQPLAEKKLADMTIAEMRAVADLAGIDLGKARKRQEIHDVIEAELAARAQAAQEPQNPERDGAETDADQGQSEE